MSLSLNKLESTSDSEEKSSSDKPTLELEEAVDISSKIPVSIETGFIWSGERQIIKNTVTILPEGWEELIISFEKELDEIFETLQKEIQKGKQIFPNFKEILRPFYETPFEKVKVLILGQEPYHNPGQANGLAFSVNKGTEIPPSLANILYEIKTEIENFNFPTHGDLTSWTKQGILLLNCSLTVEKERKISHKMVWRGIIRETIKKCSNKGKVIFVLWGKEAYTFDKYIDTSKNTILKSSHPSPHSAEKGFFGCNHFKKINELLDTPINWNL